MKFKENIPIGRSHNKQQADRAPKEAPEIFPISKWGAYFLRHTATPTW